MFDAPVSAELCRNLKHLILQRNTPTGEGVNRIVKGEFKSFNRSIAALRSESLKREERFQLFNRFSVEKRRVAFGNGLAERLLENEK
jgi:hypothetical protein